MAKDPVLPLYYNDITSSTQDWTDEEFGAYMRLLIYQWDKGALPETMGRMNRVAESSERNWPILSKKFKQTESGMKNDRMEEIREDRTKFKEKQKENRSRRTNSTTKPQPEVNQKSTKTLPLEEEEEIEGEEEFVKGKFILSEMVSIYREHVEGYPYDPENDNKALGAIIKAIKVQAEIKTDPATDKKAMDEVLICWRQMSMSISKDSFYKDMGLKTIANNITTIFLKTKNGSATSKNGSSNSRGDAQSFFDAAGRMYSKGE